MATSVVLRPRGPFSVAAAAAFLHDFPPVDAGDDEAVVALALRVEGTWTPFVAVVRAEGDAVRAELHGPGADEGEAAREQLERVLSLDVDGTGFAALADRDPVPERALEALRELPGIGPFGAELVLVRGVGEPDGFPGHEPRLHAAMRAAYGLGPEAGLDAPRAIADGWRPFRAWVALLLRSAAPPG